MTREPLVLSPAWQQWLAAALIEGRPDEALIAALRAAGLDDARARAEVLALAAHPATVAARAHGQTVALRRQQLRLARTVDVRPGLDVPTLLGVYVAHGVPVRVPGFCASWPARTTWTPERLRARLGHVEVRAVLDADVPDRDRHYRCHTRTIRFADYIDAVEEGPPGNDRYLLANHHNVDDALAPMLDDVDPPEGLLAPGWRRGGASLWYGPAGTHTPTHHDTTTVVFCQVRGRKRLWLAPPEEHRLGAARGGYYAPVPLSDPAVTGPGGALEGGTVLSVDIEPGDMVLIPAGWWHEVLALETSMSLGLVALSVPNRVEVYRPGFLPKFSV